MYFDNIISSTWKILNYRNASKLTYLNALWTWKSDIKNDKNIFKPGLQHIICVWNGIDKKSFALHSDRSYIHCTCIWFYQMINTDSVQNPLWLSFYYFFFLEKLKRGVAKNDHGDLHVERRPLLKLEDNEINVVEGRLWNKYNSLIRNLYKKFI